MSCAVVIVLSVFVIFLHKAAVCQALPLFVVIAEHHKWISARGAAKEGVCT